MFFEVSGVLEALPAMFTLNSIFIAMDLKKKIKVMLLLSASGALALMGVRRAGGAIWVLAHIWMLP